MSLTIALASACAVTLALFGYAALPSAQPAGAHRRHGLARIPLRLQLAAVALIAALAINPRLTLQIGTP